MKRITLLSACLIILGTFAMVRMTTIAEGPRKRGFFPPPQDKNNNSPIFERNESAGGFGSSDESAGGEFLEPAAPVFGEPVDHMGFSQREKEAEEGRLEELEMRTKYLIHAAAALEHIGKQELARDLREEAEEIERDLREIRRRQHREHPPEDFSTEAVIHEMKKLREEVSGLRKEMRELRKVIGSINKGKPQPIKINQPQRNLGNSFQLDTF